MPVSQQEDPWTHPIDPASPGAGGRRDVEPSRRRFVGAAAIGAISAVGVAVMSLVDPLVRAGAWAAGSDKPEKEEVKIGFIPLTDCASVVMASVLGFDRKYGIKIVPTKESSWPGVRDKRVNGERDAAHVLYGLQFGISGHKTEMADARSCT